MKRIIVLLLTLALLVACQPTPEEEFVKNKSDSVLEDTIYMEQTESSEANRATLKERLNAPDRWTEEPIVKTIPYGTLTLCIDAEVHIPDTDHVGVYLCDQEQIFSEATQRALIRHYLGDDTAVFQCIRPNQRKWEFLQQIQSLQEEIAKIEADTSDPYRDELLKNRNEILDIVIGQYQNAPEDYKHRDWDGIFASGTGYERKILHVDAATDVEAHYRSFGIDAGNLVVGDETVSVDVVGWDYILADPARQIEPKTDWERRAAELALSEAALLNLGSFSVNAVYTNEEKYDPNSGDSLDAVVVLCPITDGVRSCTFHSWKGNDVAVGHAREEGLLPERDYNSYVEPCELWIGFSGEQLAFVQLRGAYSVKSCENPNVQLLPFSEIEKIFMQQAPVHFFIGSPGQTSEECSSHVYVTDVWLNMMRVRKRAADGEYYLLPVWDFSFYEVDERYETKEEVEKRGFYTRMTMLTINAIDGTVIDRENGY